MSGNRYINPPRSHRSTVRRFSMLVLLVLPLAPMTKADGVKPDDLEFFERRIRPLLVEHCYKCHSAEAGDKVKGGLLLDTRDGLLNGGDTRAAINPGEPDKSLLIEAVRYTNEDLQMPPKEKLGEQQIADLVEWVRRGAPDPRTGTTDQKQSAIDIEAGRRWWAFQPIRPQPAPQVKDEHWAKTPIDRFILARLEESRLRPAPPADKRTLLRRATQDLTGLPPTTGELVAFLWDDSPDAFAKVVDRLLSSPHYGERWARHWLDVVRYTDSFDARGLGGAKDCAEAWRYRDWVVDAFNRDLPYDQFVMNQIAGDLLPAKDPGGFNAEGVIATGVMAIGNWGGGDADKEKLLTDIADDQVDLVGRAFLGLTLACARCHDHKFDPITAEDYYGLAGIFFSSHILPNPGPKTDGPDLLRIPLVSKEELQQRERAKAKLAEIQKQQEQLIDREIAKLAAEMLPKLPEYLDRRRAASDDLHPTLARRWKEVLASTNLKLLDKPLANIHNVPGVYARATTAGDTPSLTINTRDDEARFITIKLPPRSVAVHPSPKAGVSVAFKSPVTGALKIEAHLADADPNCGDGVEWRLRHQQTPLAAGWIASGASQTIPAATVTVAAGDFLHLTISPRNGYECDTTTVELTISHIIEGQSAETWKLSNDLTKDPHKGNPHGPWHFIDDAGSIAIPPAVAKLSNAASSASIELDKPTRDFLTSPTSPFWQPLRSDPSLLSLDARQKRSALESEIANLKSKIETPFPLAHGLQEGGCPQSPHAGIHDVHVHIRGRYERLGKLIPRRFPLVLAGDNQPPITEGSGRLQLARWIASAQNPLTARVIVNRIWQQHFGDGLVRTPNNFGQLGERPTHPALLDYLAHRFIASGWSMKSLHRDIMLSAVYQQSSTPAPASLKPQPRIQSPLAVDPDNRLFSRMNRRRLDAEQIRDALLSVTGELDRTMRGPAVRDFNAPRRTLYMMTVRSDRSTYRMLFDAADPTAIIDKRIDSTVAPQALFLLNNPFITSRTRALAQRVLNQDLADDPARIRWLYQTLFSRIPTDREIEIGLHSVQQRDGAPIRNADAQLAWERYCQVLLCTNEFIYVD